MTIIERSMCHKIMFIDSVPSNLLWNRSFVVHTDCTRRMRMRFHRSSNTRLVCDWHCTKKDYWFASSIDGGGGGGEGGETTSILYLSLSLSYYLHHLYNTLSLPPFFLSLSIIPSLSLFSSSNLPSRPPSLLSLTPSLFSLPFPTIISSTTASYYQFSLFLYPFLF